MNCTVGGCRAENNRINITGSRRHKTFGLIRSKDALTFGVGFNVPPKEKSQAATDLLLFSVLPASGILPPRRADRVVSLFCVTLAAFTAA